ncbi:uncharacterized protein Z519_07244 [Cladophialophora bantiana CBS 173.52]|uniref:Unplaced genomic scaffold supercont1.10, whole genome shotgun sequence n=1 Tax=Cladophialophora bantiana (strain ATCC 10958 / CBS 173.52 / CDC B-1940 / NIH 8579) TaxID=1442370 RepID=A0A0D2HN50_CLAB1|nr:uncharacterized protein Z519_07244 [Cladophialophora bantiana CBS 173.52]KIW92260.1 hypothetical protein Z519_07244 [Cladophialophora bantiana CBS 173.52]
MASRRSSTFSTRSIKQRKYSTDRHQRGAELSIRIEEGRSLRPPLVQEEDISTSFVQDFFSKPPLSKNVAASLTHADTFPCPLDIHPGQRVRGFSDAFDDDHKYSVVEDSLEFKNPFPEPNPQQQLEIEQRGAVFRRVNTDINAEEAQIRITRSASDARGRGGANHPIDRVRRWLGIKTAIKPGAYNGLKYAAGLATTHATAILSQKPAPLFKRRALYVLEYDVDDQGVLLCAPPKLCESVSSLRKHLEEGDQPGSVLRLVYVCNNEEAVNYLSNAFGISGSSTETGERSFRDWMQDDRDTRRASHKAIRWRPAFDIARGVICTAFGLDFGSLVVPRQGTPPPHHQQHSQPSQTTTASLYRQRISVYMQRASSQALPGPRVTRFNSGSRHLHDMAKRDTIIICEYSSGEAGEIVSANVLLGLNPGPFATPSPGDGEEEKPILDRKVCTSTPTLQAVLSHIFDGLYQLWRDQIALIHEPHASLEDHIYAHPSDSSRARDVWAMSQRLHNMLKLVNRHSKVIEAVQDDFAVFAETERHYHDGGGGAERKDREPGSGRDGRRASGGSRSSSTWLTPLLDDFEVLAENIGTDYLEPLEHMIDLMYKSVTIRDSKQSLELNASLWRLSWITFIFLPLTFLVGAFGMNVDAFRQYPSLKWYFVAAVPLMLAVFFLWFAMRRFGPGRHSSGILDMAILGTGLEIRSL